MKDIFQKNMWEQDSLPSLPMELLEKICCLLAVSDLVRVEAVCRRLRDSLHTSRVWRREAEQQVT